MSKKSRRQRRPNLPPEAFNSPQAAIAARPTADKAASAAPAQRRVAEVNWKEEYGEVMGDLKRTAVLAVILMAAMGALALIIH